MAGADNAACHALGHGISPAPDGARLSRWFRQCWLPIPVSRGASHISRKAHKRETGFVAPYAMRFDVRRAGERGRHGVEGGVDCSRHCGRADDHEMSAMASPYALAGCGCRSADGCGKVASVVTRSIRQRGAGSRSRVTGFDDIEPTHPSRTAIKPWSSAIIRVPVLRGAADASLCERPAARVSSPPSCSRPMRIGRSTRRASKLT